MWVRPPPAVKPLVPVRQDVKPSRLAFSAIGRYDFIGAGLPLTCVPALALLLRATRLPSLGWAPVRGSRGPRVRYPRRRGPYVEGVDFVGHEGFEKVVIFLGVIVLAAAVIVAIVQFLL